MTAMESLPELYLLDAQDGQKLLKPFASARTFSESHVESDIEDWVKNSLLHGEPILGDLAVFAQQPGYRASRERRPDLLAIDGDKNIVVIEFKRSDADEDILFQTLNYAAWIGEQAYEVLNQMAQNFLTQHQPHSAPSLKEYFYSHFPLPPTDSEPADPSAGESVLPTDGEFLSGFNQDPRINHRRHGNQ